MVIYGDAHFVCWYGSPRWLPASWGFQVWFWCPGLSSQFQTELEKQSQTQKSKGRFARFCDALSGKEQNQPSSFSELWPIGSSLVLYELKEGDDPEEQIVTGLSREQIESRIFAIRSWLSGSPVQADFVEQLRLSGFHWKGSVFVSSTQNTPASPHPPVGDIRKDGFQRCDDGYSFFFNIPNASAQLPKVS